MIIDYFANYFTTSETLATLSETESLLNDAANLTYMTILDSIAGDDSLNTDQITALNDILYILNQTNGANVITELEDYENDIIDYTTLTATEKELILEL